MHDGQSEQVLKNRARLFRRLLEVSIRGQRLSLSCTERHGQDMLPRLGPAKPLLGLISRCAGYNSDLRKQATTRRMLAVRVDPRADASPAISQDNVIQHDR